MYLDLLLIATFTLCMWNLLSLNIHIFQLNHYKNKFQIDWIKKNFKKIAKKSLLFFAGIISLLLFKNVGKVIASILFIIGFFINRRKNEKINLVYTNRVKRLIGTAYIGYLIIFIATYRLTNNYVIAYISLEICSILAPILMLVLRNLRTRSFKPSMPFKSAPVILLLIRFVAIMVVSTLQQQQYYLLILV